MAKKEIRGLFELGSNAVVIGLPSDFDLSASIKSSAEIRLATAFAHRSGWEMIKESIRASNAIVKLLTGLNFCQTEPLVLKDWIALAENQNAFARIYIGPGTTFHPKVLIVSSPASRFAVVGSANLSEGGFRNNVECSILARDKDHLDALQFWFDSLFEDPSVTGQLTTEGVRQYEPKFDTARRALASARAAQHEIESELAKRQIRPPSNFEDLMLPILQFLRDGRPRSSEEIKSIVLSGLGQLGDRDELGTFRNWVDLGFNVLVDAKVIAKPALQIYEITLRGQDLLAGGLSVITKRWLIDRFEDYRRLQRERSDKAVRTKERKKAAVIEF